MGFLQKNTCGDRILLLRIFLVLVLVLQGITGCVPGPSPLLGHSKDQRAQPEGTKEGAE